MATTTLNISDSASSICGTKVINMATISAGTAGPNSANNEAAAGVRLGVTPALVAITDLRIVEPAMTAEYTAVINKLRDGDRCYL